MSNPHTSPLFSFSSLLSPFSLPPYSYFDIISSLVVFSLFIGTVVTVYRFTHKASEAMDSKKEAWKGKGVTVNRTGISVQTSSVAPSREEYIASTQRAFEQSAAIFQAKPEAISFGKDDGSSPSPLSRSGTGTPKNSSSTTSVPADSAAAAAARPRASQEQQSTAGNVERQRGRGAGVSDV